ncbi:MAG TPA: glycosyltransferase family 2 protein [Bacilli bacterium]|nr:glycosyltransferase family 2 protein [Bacilli bacterium]
MKKISIIIPCHNEEKNISPLYSSILELKEKLDYNIELVFIDDGSKDSTYEIIKKLNPVKDLEIKAIKFSRNFGKEAAMYAGIENAKGDYAVFIDADMQQDPALIKEMVKKIESDSNYDAVCYFQEERIENKFIAALKDLFYKIINKTAEVKFVKGASDFRLINRKMLDAILSMKETSRFSKGIFAWIGFNTCYLPYKAKERQNGNTNWSVGKLFKYAISGIMSFSDAPIHLVTIVGAILFIASILNFISLTVQMIFFPNEFLHNSILIGFIAFYSSIQLLALGIVGEYITRVYGESKKRPIYIAKEIIKLEYKK